jgi:hypothetical protein
MPGKQNSLVLAGGRGWPPGVIGIMRWVPGGRELPRKNIFKKACNSSK